MGSVAGLSTTRTGWRGCWTNCSACS